MQNVSDINLTLPLQDNLLPFLQHSVEEASRAWGMDDKGALRLTLGAEEIYAFLLARKGSEELSRVEIALSDQGASVKLSFTLPKDSLPLEAFNLVSGQEKPFMTGSRYGLFLASRMVSSLAAEEEEQALRSSGSTAAGGPGGGTPFGGTSFLRSSTRHGGRSSPLSSLGSLDASGLRESRRSRAFLGT